MQLLALVAMEPPATFDADALRDEKVKVLRAIEPMTPARRRGATSCAASTGRAGWPASRCPATAQEPEVDPESETETYVAARLFVDDWRWAGVPFYLRAGKRLPKRATEIAIQFQQVPHAAVQGLERRPGGRTCSPSGSSPTRGSCCASRPRSRAWAWTSGA